MVRCYSENFTVVYEMLWVENHICFYAVISLERTHCATFLYTLWFILLVKILVTQHESVILLSNRTRYATSYLSQLINWNIAATVIIGTFSFFLTLLSCPVFSAEAREVAIAGNRQFWRAVGLMHGPESLIPAYWCMFRMVSYLQWTN